jgi:hypothetical protein
LVTWAGHCPRLASPCSRELPPRGIRAHGRPRRLVLRPRIGGLLIPSPKIAIAGESRREWGCSGAASRSRGGRFAELRRQQSFLLEFMRHASGGSSSRWPGDSSWAQSTGFTLVACKTHSRFRGARVQVLAFRLPAFHPQVSAALLWQGLALQLRRSQRPASYPSGRGASSPRIRSRP